MDGEPDLALGVEDAAEVGPGHGEVGPGFDRFQITSLEVQMEREQGRRGGGGEGKSILVFFVTKVADFFG